jgi:hypothetical protein
MNRRTRSTRRGLLAALSVAATLAACSSDGGEDSSSVEADAAERTTTTIEGGLPAGAEDLVGRWAHFDAVSYEDETMRTVIISTGFADLELRDGELWNQMTFCHADTVMDQDIQVSISDAATGAIKPIATAMEVTEVEGALHLARPATPTPIGIKLDDPANEKLPTDPNDPRIFDADGDGNPGVTSTIKVTDDFGGEVYLARREIFVYDLVQQSADRLEGSITDSSEQLIIGASDPAFFASAQWEQIDDPARNPVIWERVEDDWDCDRLAEERDDLFPPNPQTDW